MGFSSFLRRRIAVLALLLVGLQPVFVSAASLKVQLDGLFGQVDELTQKAVEGQYIVLLKHQSKTDALLKKHGIASIYQYDRAVTGFAAKLSAAQLEKLKQESDVELIEPDYIVTAFAKRESPRANFDWDKFFKRSSSSRSSSSSSRSSSSSSRSSSSSNAPVSYTHLTLPTNREV